MAKRQKKNKKLTKKELQQFQELKKNIFFCILSCILVLALGYLIFETDILRPELNEMTASYISFNNSNTTDMLKISNLEKASNKKGKSSANTKSVSFKVTGKKNTPYDIVVYPINKDNDFKNIKFSLTENDELLNSSTLNSKPVSSDGGIIIYRGKVKESGKLTLRMWLTRKYHKNAHNLSFEVKVKTR